MNDWEILLEEPVTPEGLTLLFGVVTQAAPPMVRIGKDTTASAVNTSCVTLAESDVTNGTRVVVIRNGRRLILLAKVIYSTGV